MINVAVFLVLALTACGTHVEATLTVGPEGFEPPLQKVPANRSFDLQIVNDTKTVQEVTVRGQPPLRVAPGEKGSRQVGSLKPGDYKVTLLDAPFEATLRAGE